jgi:hypothetical protein
MLQLILFYLPSLLCGVHVVRTGREMYWLWIFIIGPVVGPAFYFFAVLLPELMGGRTARGMGRVAQAALNPERDYRAAKLALDETPTVGNRMRLAQAAVALGRWDEAEPLWAECAVGAWANDPAILLGHANTLIELGRFDTALKRLEHLRSLGKDGETAQAALAFARAYEGLGRLAEADGPYRFAADRVPGLEAGARYVAYMARAGRKADAELGLAELDRRLSKIAPPLRPEARRWRDLAAKAVQGAT